MTAFLQLLFQGFALGCIYALVALGFTVVYRASKVINFAQGSLLLVGAYLVSVLATGLNRRSKLTRLFRNRRGMTASGTS